MDRKHHRRSRRELGAGVAYKHVGEVDAVWIGYSGYSVQTDWSEELAVGPALLAPFGVKKKDSRCIPVQAVFPS